MSLTEPAISDDLVAQLLADQNALVALTAGVKQPAAAKLQLHTRLVNEFAVTHGHTRVPQAYAVEGVKLGNWVRDQRSLYRRGKLARGRDAALELIPHWVWDVRPTLAEYLEAVRDFKDEFGHPNVPMRYSANGINVGLWVQNQRATYRSKTIKPEIVAALELFDGWNWSPPGGRSKRA